MQSQQIPIPQQLIMMVEHILGEAFSSNISFASGEVLQDGIRAITYRFHMMHKDTEPMSVIVKQVKTAQAPYTPERATIPAWTFFNEWASLQFLDNAVKEDSFAPRFYGGDRASGVIVMEDLGHGKRLDDYLMGNDPHAAESALVDFAAIHGRLHAMTAGRHNEFEALRASLGPSILEDNSNTYEWLAPTFYQTAKLLDITPEKDVERELTLLKASLLHPTPFLAFIQSDSCPDNCLFTGSGLRLLDFEGGRFDHALKEGVYGRMHFPSCRYVYRMPPHIPLRMEAAYRHELSKGCSEASDDQRFSRAVAEMCVYWMIQWYEMDPLARLLETDVFIVAATGRQRYLLRSEIVAQVTEEVGHLEALGAKMRAMAAKMRIRWPDLAATPLYPAFR